MRLLIPLVSAATVDAADVTAVPAPPNTPEMPGKLDNPAGIADMKLDFCDVSRLANPLAFKPCVALRLAQ
jgi:hypothetical protein